MLGPEEMVNIMQSKPSFHTWENRPRESMGFAQGHVVLCCGKTRKKILPACGIVFSTFSTSSCHLFRLNVYCDRVKEMPYN